jgi:23S rRNA pseudouridine2605 synthase
VRRDGKKPGSRGHHTGARTGTSSRRKTHAKPDRQAGTSAGSKADRPDLGPADGVRLQKLLSAAGVASRRASEQLILEGRVSVNGQTVRELGTRARPDDDIRVDGRRIRTEVRQRYILLNKPRGYVTTRDDPQGRPTVIDLLGRDAGYIYPVGRLDYDSEGLLLLTTDGALAERLTHPRHEVERVYEAIVAGVPDDEAIERLRKGVFIDGRRTAPSEVTRGHTVKAGGGTTHLTITLREGRNRQVRKMCAAVGHPVRSLVRVRMGPLTLGRMRPGEWRELTPREVRALKGNPKGLPPQIHP